MPPDCAQWAVIKLVVSPFLSMSTNWGEIAGSCDTSSNIGSDLSFATHPGVGALTALAFVLIIGTPERFASSKQLSSYIGLVPSEESSGERRRLGHISKQGNTLLRFLLVAAAQATVRSDPNWR
jgi:transposase